MLNRYAWSRHIDDEIWHGGPCDSIRECLREAYDEGYKSDDQFALGYVKEYQVNYDFAQDIVEHLCEDAWDEVGEASDGWLDSAKRAELDKLNEKITPIVKEWLKEIGETPWFYAVEPFKECTLKEALELNNDKPKGGKVNVV